MLAASLTPGLSAIENRRSGQVRAHPNRQRVGDAAAVAETDDADLAGAVGTLFQPARRRQEVFGHLLLVHLLKQLGPFSSSPG